MKILIIGDVYICPESEKGQTISHVSQNTVPV